ncbi:MAG TPA: GNAT family N-acetyltransferase [Candidatus Limivicinus faecipullorum]|nr:GNAT family N-acetyltransferase [Candidatus Limivicinus faecipullorum]
MTIRQFEDRDIEQAREIWNEIVRDGVAFPQLEELDTQSGLDFFHSQSFTGVCEENGELLGLYILHPNNLGRCGHICNASYAVASRARGRGVGEALVLHCLKTAKELGFRIMQFNAVVSNNTTALRLYAKLGFTQLGVIPGGFLMKDGSYQDIIPHYKEL